MNEHDATVAFLKRENLLAEADLAALLEQQAESGQSLLTLVGQRHDLDEAQKARIAAAAQGIEFVTLAPEMIDPVVAHLISHAVAARLRAIPLRKDGRTLAVAMSEPQNLAARDEIELKTGYKVTAVAATPQAIQQAIHYHFDVTSVTKQAIASMRLKGDGPGPTGGRPRSERLFDASDDPITKLVASIIKGGVEVGASDIHIEPQESKLGVRYRIDGMLRDALEVPVSAQLEVVSHIKILSDMDIAEKRVPQDGHITLAHEGREYDLRVSSLPAVGGEKIVLRILDKNADRWVLDDVVTDPRDRATFKSLVANPYGMILLTGPTGSGKTTTLYSVLQEVNAPQRNIVTVEDPVEYRLSGITQVQVNPVAGLTFACALRSILRQDPDVILVGEIRDRETAEIAISAALTGHLVLSTLHTNDAAGAVSRLINIGIPPFLVASALLGTVAQRLVRTLCPHCKTPYEASGEEGGLVASPASAGEGRQLYRAGGCRACYESGYHGRRSVYEILGISPAIRRMIVEGRSDAALKEQAVTEGMRTLRTRALEEVRRGATTIDEVMRVVDLTGD
ncbi:MAG: type II/IV secretion system protein [Sedimentisphaerales bacterium]|nr:type II/IV secretion system protein [Sedimentisphaerales bacterium]